VKQFSETLMKLLIKTTYTKHVTTNGTYKKYLIGVFSNKHLRFRVY